MANSEQWRRRDLLGAALALPAARVLARPAEGDQRPAPAKPRAIAGDRVEPEWESRLTPG